MSETTPLLSGRGLRKTYRLGRVNVPVLKGASLDVAAGEWVAVVGSSGSGKSTLLHLLGGLDQPDRLDGGTVLFEGQIVSSLGPGATNRYRNRKVGFVFQFYHLLPELSVVDNATLPAMVGRSPFGWLGARAIRRRANELLGAFGLGHRLHHRPNELSGGERQRVAIARALVNDPQVLLADEPTGNLDAKTGQEILDVVRDLHRKGLTIVMVTHDPTIAAQADRRVALVDGAIA
ncbi:MAG: ABC transporter ATP-binding protein [Phycisphaerae bacterium]|nr:ABC transporter ATP-binding protein [Phycisphaerae bacterium]